MKIWNVIWGESIFQIYFLEDHPFKLYSFIFKQKIHPGGLRCYGARIYANHVKHLSWIFVTSQDKIFSGENIKVSIHSWFPLFTYFFFFLLFYFFPPSGCFLFLFLLLSFLWVLLIYFRCLLITLSMPPSPYFSDPWIKFIFNFFIWNWMGRFTKYCISFLIRFKTC